MRLVAVLALAGALLLGTQPTMAASAWAGDLAPLPASEWNQARAAHLLERAGFGGTPEEVAALAALAPWEAVRRLVYFEGASQVALAPFDPSGIFDEGLDALPPSRPATTDLAKARGEAIGVKVKPAGNRPLQPVVNQFFYWLRASRLETHRVAYWWAHRMLASPRPFEEKMALFWHGHFATSEEKVRDYRKMLQQLELFQREGRGNFRSLLVGAAQDPAMLAFLDAGINVKGAPNENFAREIMEMFSMGVGNYSEQDIREAARAFTGWNYRGLAFHVDADKHDDAEKTVLGRSGRFDGVEVIDLFLAQPVTAEYIAGRLYAHFVREAPDPALRKRLGDLLRANRYEIAPFMEAVFLAKDFYAPESVATHIKSPVELLVSTYRKLGLKEIPGMPDFNETTGALGQRLMYPPTVAGWAGGRSWVTPGLLIQRGNFALDVVFPDIAFLPQDRYPVYSTGSEIRAVHERVRAGMDITAATRPVDKDDNPEMLAASSRNVDRDEDFNTRYASYRGWQMAIERVKPIPRVIPRLDLTGMVLGAGCKTPLEAVRYLERRFLSVPLDEASRRAMADFLARELGTADLRSAETFAEEPLRLTLHLILSRPEYQLG
jgi:uncharacterized protein DUF1800